MKQRLTRRYNNPNTIHTDKIEPVVHWFGTIIADAMQLFSHQAGGKIQHITIEVHDGDESLKIVTPRRPTYNSDGSQKSERTNNQLYD